MKEVISLRLTPDLVAWVKQQAALHTGGDRTRFITEFLEAARAGRLITAPQPIPRVINDGSVPECPVMVCLAPK